MAGPNQRLDKWLWHARMLKTRSQATAFSAAGKVRINGKRVEKASIRVAPDDVLTFAIRDQVKVLKVVQISARRGPFTEAVELYEDLSPPEPEKERSLPKLPHGREPGQGRPTKRDRRVIDRWNQQHE